MASLINSEANMQPTIMKFGGTSVEDAGAVRNVATIVKAAVNSRPVVVISAIGGFTNSLITSVERTIEGDARGASKALEADFERHQAMGNDLLQTERRAALVAGVGDARAQTR